MGKEKQKIGPRDIVKEMLRANKTERQNKDYWFKNDSKISGLGCINKRNRKYVRSK